MSTTSVGPQTASLASGLFTEDMSRSQKALIAAQHAAQAEKRTPPAKGIELERLLDSLPTVAFQFKLGDEYNYATRPSPGVISDILFALRTGYWEQARTCWHRPVEPRSALYDYVGREIRRLVTDLLQSDAKFVLILMLPCDEKFSFWFNGYDDEEEAILALASDCLAHIESMIMSPW